MYLELWGALWPIQSGNFKIWQLITHMFMHGGILHIFFNMFGLIMFGKILENFWGAKRFFQFYLICGIVAGIAHLLLSGSEGYAIGASGAVMGILAGFAYLFPNTPLFLFLIPIPIKAKWLIPGLMALDVFGAVSSQPSNIAHWAHLGGAAAGLLLVIIWNKSNRKTFY
ncbi:MAG: rhomboid family intramembrane serine protease [Chitinophagaceae bacterium]